MRCERSPVGLISHRRRSSNGPGRATRAVSSSGYHKWRSRPPFWTPSSCRPRGQVDLRNLTTSLSSVMNARIRLGAERTRGRRVINTSEAESAWLAAMCSKAVLEVIDEVLALSSDLDEDGVSPSAVSTPLRIGTSGVRRGRQGGRPGRRAPADLSRRGRHDHRLRGARPIRRSRRHRRHLPCGRGARPRRGDRDRRAHRCTASPRRAPRAHPARREPVGRRRCPTNGCTSCSTASTRVGW